MWSFLSPGQGTKTSLQSQSLPGTGLKPIKLEFPDHCQGGNLPNKTPATLPPRNVPLPETMLSFLLLINSLSCPVSTYKNLPVCTTSQSIYLLIRWDAARFLGHSIKPIRSLNLLHLLLLGCPPCPHLLRVETELPNTTGIRFSRGPHGRMRYPEKLY